MENISYQLVEWRKIFDKCGNVIKQEEPRDVFCTLDPEEFCEYVRKNGCNTHSEDYDPARGTFVKCYYEIFKAFEIACPACA